MPPVMNRADSRERCRQGWDLRRRGRTWDEVATELGWKSRAAACKAVNKWLTQNPQDDLETMRRASGDTLVEMTTKLAAAVPDALEAGKFRDAAELGKVVIDGVDKYAKLTGQHVVVPKQVDVTVTQTLTQVLAQTRERLMSVIEGEVIDVQETRQVQA